LYAHLGILFCPSCGREIKSHSVDQITDTILALGEKNSSDKSTSGTVDKVWIKILTPFIRRQKADLKKILLLARQQGFLRVIIDGKMSDLDDDIPELTRKKRHTIEVVIDRFKVTPDERDRLSEGIELAMKMGKGQVTVEAGKHGRLLFSSSFTCPECQLIFPEISPRSFSFNSPVGACEECQGIGRVFRVDGALILPPVERVTLHECIDNWNTVLDRRPLIEFLKKLRNRGIDTETPVLELTKKDKKWILHGTNRTGSKWTGIVNLMAGRYKRVKSGYIREKLKRYIGEQVCPSCEGHRLRPESLAVRFRDKNLAELTVESVKSLVVLFSKLVLTSREIELCGLVIDEIRNRLDFLLKVGVGYLTLRREVGTLSGGEFQRIRLAGQLGSQLTGVLYVLDEPSVGLHPLDQRNLLRTLFELRDLGNTVLVVEHDRDTILRADHIIDLGPGAGKKGGEIVFSGSLKNLVGKSQSVTARYLNTTVGNWSRETNRLSPDRGFLRLLGAREHNLRNITAEFPIGLLTCVTGVSGSGKSTLVLDTLYRSLAQRLQRRVRVRRPGGHDSLEGVAAVDRIVVVDAAPIGRSSRSNPATYTKVFGEIRQLFSMIQAARERGYNSGRFSFNVAGGRCEACAGEGVCRIQMQFMPDVFVTCEVCDGKRYNRETLEIKYRGVNIAEVLSMTVREALEFFQDIPGVRRRLEMLDRVGLGYLELGQPAPSLSAGEVQRMKLSRELSRKSCGRTVYILDEPTTGLHFADIEILLDVLKSLVNRGETVIIVEHNIDVVLNSDWVIDLGPGGGAEGGNLLGSGPPEHIAGLSKSVTGQFIRESLSCKTK
jgi:excinuclease ABC subunit A